ncbi:MAG: phosphoribosylglycinamide formyltransferase [Plesiomonas sp.]|uniref:phosphoribosylglycinamide formyltransferase n=1 Tax=Plesiomonas sp. TaxID=2486279 RepID=UPI003EE7B589
MHSSSKNIVVLASGNGSNLQAILDACESGRIQGQVTAVISDRADAFALERAQSANIPAEVLRQRDFADRDSFDAALAEAVSRYQPDLVVLAGFMRVLNSAFVQQFSGKLLNIHPSLLPKYRGLNTHQRAIDAGDTVHGASIHFVTEQLDGGPIILQAQVPIFEDDTAAEVAQRVQEQEHRSYPLVINWYLDGRLSYQENQAWMDGKPLPEQGYAAE